MDKKELLEIIKKAAKTKQQELDLSDKGIKILPPEIGTLTNLMKLDLSRNQLTSLPLEIGQITNLAKLVLFSNQLTVLPETMSRLKNLTDLTISCNRFTSFPRVIFSLSRLTGLYAIENQIAEVPSEIASLKNLEKLVLGGTQISPNTFYHSRVRKGNEIFSLPAEIGQLTNLTNLHLSNNQLALLPPEIGQLKNLTALDLSDNQLTSLPESIRNIRSLKYLRLHGNPGLGLPEELLGPSPIESIDKAIRNAVEAAQILDYYFRTRGGRRALNEAKVILVGRGEVGKTCIVNRLVRDVFEDTSKTEGIQISDWKVRLGSDDVRLNIWDFGGQEIMHATHQFFLTHRSLYLLVLNGREGGEDYDAEYWLKLIESFAGDSPVIIQLNKIGQHPFDLNYRGLQEKYPQIRGFVKTDCKTSDGFDQLRSEIVRVLGEMKSIKADFPSTWFTIKDTLAGMKENYLSFEQFREVCRANGETDIKAQDELAVFLHCLGIALNYKEDPRLRDTSVLNPRWVTQGIYRLLNAKELAKNKGILYLSDMAKILPAQEYPAEKHEFLMELMRKFRLCFAFPDGHLRYLVPELLSKEEPDLKSEFVPEQCLNFEYRYSILPEGLLPQFIVRTHILSHNQPRWRSGVVLQWEGCRALVKADIADRRVVVRIEGGNPEGRRRLLALIRFDFERIHSDIRALNVKEAVPVPRHPGVVIDYDKLLLMEQKGVREFPEAIGDDIVMVNTTDLLNGVDLPNVRRRPGPEERKREPLRLFWSYSHKDETLRDELESHLKLLERQGVLSSWHDRRILAGEKWEGKIDENLEKADIILLLISADFIASDYCYKIEMMRALERHGNKDATVIPVIIRDVNWTKAPFAKLQALPKDGKAAMLWANRDTAWRNVSEGIEKIAGEILRKKEKL